MPGKSEKVRSEAQRKWAFAAEKRGELKKGTAKRWSKKVKGEKLPKHVKGSDRKTKKLHAWANSKRKKKSK